MYHRLPTPFQAPSDNFPRKKIVDLHDPLPTTILLTCPRKDTWQGQPKPAATGFTKSRPPPLAAILNEIALLILTTYSIRYGLMLAVRCALGTAPAVQVGDRIGVAQGRRKPRSDHDTKTRSAAKPTNDGRCRRTSWFQSTCVFKRRWLHWDRLALPASGQCKVGNPIKKAQRAQCYL